MTRAERIAKTPIEKVASLDKKALEAQVKQLRYGYRRRAQSLNKSGYFSHALDKFETTRGSASDVSTKELTRNQLLNEWARYADFFNAKTSSIKGIKEVNLHQDLSIFGEKEGSTEEKPIPVYRMSEDERKEYWRLYDEFRNEHPELAQKSYSEFAQQTLAEANFMGEKVSENLPKFLKQVAKETRKKIRSYGRSMPNVYMGRRNDTNK